MVFWGIGAGLGWILKPFPLLPPTHAPLHRRGKLIFFLKEQKERKVRDSKQREGASWLPHTPGKQKPTKKFFSVSPPVLHLPVKNK